MVIGQRQGQRLHIPVLVPVDQPLNRSVCYLDLLWCISCVHCVPSCLIAALDVQHWRDDHDSDTPISSDRWIKRAAYLLDQDIETLKGIPR